MKKSIIRQLLYYCGLMLLISLSSVLYVNLQHKMKLTYRGGEWLLVLISVAYVGVAVLLLLRTMLYLRRPDKTMIPVSLICFAITALLVVLRFKALMQNSLLAYPLVMMVGASELFDAIAVNGVLRKKSSQTPEV